MNSVKEQQRKILIVDDEAVHRGSLRHILSTHYAVLEARSAEEGLPLLERGEEIDLVILDINMPGGMSGFEALKKIRDTAPQTEVIMYTSDGEIGSVVECIKMGAFDYIVKYSLPDDIILKKVANALEALARRRENARLVGENQKLAHDNEWMKFIIDKDFCSEIIGNSPAILEVKKGIRAITSGCANTTVLITGENGVGKELVAKAVHKHTSKNGISRPFVAVNVAALSKELIDSELFGHVKGAFTGAVNHKRGLVELARDGDLFLDEIGELPVELQVKLLRVLQEKEFKPVGAETTKKAHFRLIAATNKDLQNALKEGTFREDLYYRLNVFTIDVPPLRKRKEDIPLLVDFFVAQLQKEQKKRMNGVSKELLHHFLNYDWPGNIRELRNHLERGIILAPEGASIQYSHVREPLRGALDPSQADDHGGILKLRKQKNEEEEKELIERTLRMFNGNIKAAAEHLGLSRSMIYRRFEKYNIARESFRVVAGR